MPEHLTRWIDDLAFFQSFFEMTFDHVRPCVAFRRGESPIALALIVNTPFVLLMMQGNIDCLYRKTYGRA